jgi:hypothetical protein
VSYSGWVVQMDTYVSRQPPVEGDVVDRVAEDLPLRFPDAVLLHTNGQRLAIVIVRMRAAQVSRCDLLSQALGMARHGTACRREGIHVVAWR